MEMIDSGGDQPLASTVYFRTTNRRNNAFRGSHYCGFTMLHSGQILI